MEMYRHSTREGKVRTQWSLHAHGKFLHRVSFQSVAVQKVNYVFGAAGIRSKASQTKSRNRRRIVSQSTFERDST